MTRIQGAANLAYLHDWDAAVSRVISSAERVFLFLDIDGTLAEIAPTPGDVAIDPERLRCLAELAGTPDTLVAITSGRRLEEVRDLIPLPGVFYIGVHGLEAVTPCGEKIYYPVSEGISASLQALRQSLSDRVRPVPGMFLEDKGLSLALHFRLASAENALPVKKAFCEAVRKYQERGIGLEILKGKEVVEAKAAGKNKGGAAADLLERYGKGACPIYIGDDLTDETAFQSLWGINVLVTEMPRPTSASYYVRNPDEVYEFLKKIIAWRRNHRSAEKL